MDLMLKYTKLLSFIFSFVILGNKGCNLLDNQIFVV
jgi:hypothetical protein